MYNICMYATGYLNSSFEDASSETTPDQFVYETSDQSAALDEGKTMAWRNLCKPTCIRK